MLKIISVLFLFSASVSFAADNAKTTKDAKTDATARVPAAIPETFDVEKAKIYSELGRAERWYDSVKKVTCYVVMPYSSDGVSMSCIKDSDSKK